MARSGTTQWTIEIDGASRLLAKLQVLGETDAPYLRAALEEGGQLLRGAAEAHSPASFHPKFKGPTIRPYSGSLRAIVSIRHPAVRSMEFGRFNYYRGYTGRAMKSSGHKFHVAAGRGQRPKPIFGIVNGDGAVGAVGDKVEVLLREAIAKEWERLV